MPSSLVTQERSEILFEKWDSTMKANQLDVEQRSAMETHVTK